MTWKQSPSFVSSYLRFSWWIVSHHIFIYKRSASLIYFETCLELLKNFWIKKKCLWLLMFWSPQTRTLNPEWYISWQANEKRKQNQHVSVQYIWNRMWFIPGNTKWFVQNPVLTQSTEWQHLTKQQQMFSEEKFQKT